MCRDGAGYYGDGVDDETSVSNLSRVSQGRNVVERSQHMLQAKKEREEALRAALEQQELEEVRTAPTINKRSQIINRSVDDMLRWEQQRKERLESKTAQARAAEEREVTGRPTLSKKAQTDKLAALGLAQQQKQLEAEGWGDEESCGSVGEGSCARTAATGDTNGSGGAQAVVPVQDRLLEHEQRRRLKQQQLIAQKRNEARARAHSATQPSLSQLPPPPRCWGWCLPRIANEEESCYEGGNAESVAGSHMRDDVSVGERLYYEAQQQQRLQQQLDEIGEAQRKAVIKDPTTGQILFEVQ